MVYQLQFLTDSQLAAVREAVQEENDRRKCPCPRCQGGGFDPDTNADCPRCQGECDVERGTLTDAEKVDLRATFGAETLSVEFGL